VTIGRVCLQYTAKQDNLLLGPGAVVQDGAGIRRGWGQEAEGSGVRRVPGSGVCRGQEGTGVRRVPRSGVCRG
jgi:hypothetical protein